MSLVLQRIGIENRLEPESFRLKHYPALCITCGGRNLVRFVEHVWCWFSSLLYFYDFWAAMCCWKGEMSRTFSSLLGKNKYKCKKSLRKMYWWKAILTDQTDWITNLCREWVSEESTYADRWWKKSKMTGDRWRDVLKQEMNKSGEKAK